MTVVLQCPDYVDVDHCSRGVWHGHLWVWMVGENYCGSWRCFVDGGKMVGSDGPVDSVVATCLLAGGVQGLLVSLLVVGAGEPVGYGVEVA